MRSVVCIVPTRRADPPRRLKRLESLANSLDSRFTIPGTSIRFGWDSILGLVPGLGDLVTTVPAVIMLAEGYRMGARKRVLARMGLNTGLDLTLGGIPVLGDAFDLVFKANRRNMALLRAELERNAPQRQETPHG